MGRSPCCSKEQGLNKGAWTALEDKILTDYIKLHGEGKWRNIPKLAGLKRCGKSCRLRWLNYLRPDIKRGNISHDEEDLIIRLHKLLGNRWSLIAGRLPGRTDNEIKNYWNTVLSKKAKSGNEEIKKQVQSNRTDDDDLHRSRNDVVPAAPVLFLESGGAKVLESDQSDGSLSSTSDGGDQDGEYLPDFAMNFNHLVGDDINLSEILYSDFGSVKNVMAGSGGDGHISMDSDFGSLASFLESTEEWMNI